MNVADFDYDLPARFIAQAPLAQRDASRLMRLDRRSGEISHHRFTDIEAMLRPGDALVLNDTRVIPARLQAQKAVTGGKVELLLLRPVNERRWRALAGGRNVSRGTRLELAGGLSCVVVEELERAQRIIEFSPELDARELARLGRAPLPPYISAELEDSERYQTVYGTTEGIGGRANSRLALHARAA